MINIFPDNYKKYKITLIERFDEMELYKHVYSGKCDVNYSSKLFKYLNYSKNGTIPIDYIVPEIGRLSNTIYNPKTKENEWICSQTFQWNHTKALVASKDYDDVDIINCQPILLEQLMKHHKLDTRYIIVYNTNRDLIFKCLMESNNWTRKETKQFIYTIMFNSTKNNKFILKKYNIKKISPDLYKYVFQIIKNRKILKKYYPNVLKYVIKKKSEDKPYWNLEGAFLAQIAQTCERICLIAMYNYFKSKNCEVGALIHDGLHLLKNKNNINLLKPCADYVYKNTGFKITLCIKKFNIQTNLPNKIRFDTLKDINKIVIKIKYIETKYLTKLDKNDTSGIDLASKLKTNVLNLIKSYTGSGKTKMIQYIQERFPDLNIISIVSRRTLSDMHQKDFNIENYQYTYKHSYNEVYQVDSIDKVPRVCKKQYILIFDEIASLGAHLLNSMEKMSKNRLNFIKILANLINNKNCKMVIGMDSNMNYGTIKFFKDISTLPVHLYINKYYNSRATPINIYINKNKMLKDLIDLLNTGGKAFICSNMNTDFKKDIYDVILKECNLKNNEYLLYSGNDGERYVDTTKWKDKRVIFATPTIIYGCDSNFNFHVFGFYYSARHFDAFDINQQINRERSPKSINLYLSHVFVEKEYIYNSIEKAIKKNKINFQITYGILDKIEKYKEPLLNLFYYEQYRKSNHLNIRLHVIDLLRQKGYINTNFIIEKIEPIKYITKNDYIKLLIEKYHKNDLSDKMYEDVYNKLVFFGLDINIGAVNDNAMKESYNYILKNNLDYFIDNKKYRQLLNYKNYKNNLFNEIIECNDNTFKFKKKTYDVFELAVKNDSMKVYLLDMIRKKLKINKFQDNIIKTINKKNYNDEMKFKKVIIELINKSFRTQGKKKMKTIISRLDLTMFFMSKMRSVMKCIINSKSSRKMFCKKIYKINTFNTDNIKVINNIVEFRNKYKHILRTYEFEE